MNQQLADLEAQLLAVQMECKQLDVENALLLRQAEEKEAELQREKTKLARHRQQQDVGGVTPQPDVLRMVRSLYFPSCRQLHTPALLRCLFTFTTTACYKSLQQMDFSSFVAVLLSRVRSDASHATHMLQPNV